jgi:VRR-NUC domain
MSDLTAVETFTTIWCPRVLPELWKQSADGELPELAKQWRLQYPGLFDDDDVDHIKHQTQRGYHFSEWYSAIHIFQRDGALSLVEKYDAYEIHHSNQLRQKHQRKVAEFERVVPQAQRDLMHEICAEFHVGPPDLFVLPANGQPFYFVEVKGANDGTFTREDQRGVREAIRQMGIRVEVIKVRLVP